MNAENKIANPVPIKFLDLTKGTLKIRLIGEPIRYYHCKPNFKTCACPKYLEHPINPALKSKMTCRLSCSASVSNGKLVVLIQEDSKRFFGHHVWKTQCVETGEIIYAADEALIPSCIACVDL